MLTRVKWTQRRDETLVRSSSNRDIWFDQCNCDIVDSHLVRRARRVNKRPLKSERQSIIEYGTPINCRWPRFTVLVYIFCDVTSEHSGLCVLAAIVSLAVLCLLIFAALMTEKCVLLLHLRAQSFVMWLFWHSGSHKSALRLFISSSGPLTALWCAVCSQQRWGQLMNLAFNQRMAVFLPWKLYVICLNAVVLMTAQQGWAVSILLCTQTAIRWTAGHLKKGNRSPRDVFRNQSGESSSSSLALTTLYHPT